MNSGPAVDTPRLEINRRTVVGAGAGAAVASLIPAGLRSNAQEARGQSSVVTVPASTTRVSMILNGQPVEIDVDARASLLDLLRERLGVTGPKKGCDHGQCGACTVHLGGRAQVSCLTLAAKASGRALVTIEGLATGTDLHEMQRAFIDHDALQCGYCTPGQIMSAIACVRQGQAASRQSIREFMSGNVCRCAAYAGIVAAIEDVAARSREG